MIDFIKKYLSMILITIILLLLYGSLLKNHSSYFEETQHRLSSNETIHLNSESSKLDIKNILLENHYVQTETEATFIANILTERFDSVRQIGSLSELKNNFWKATIEEVENYGGECHKESYARMCYDLEQYYLSNNQNTSNMLSKISVDEKCEGKIEVFVYEKQKNVSYISKVLKKDKTFRSYPFYFGFVSILIYRIILFMRGRPLFEKIGLPRTPSTKNFQRFFYY
jgi:hypothetical protein